MPMWLRVNLVSYEEVRGSDSPYKGARGTVRARAMFGEGGQALERVISLCRVSTGGNGVRHVVKRSTGMGLARNTGMV